MKHYSLKIGWLYPDLMSTYGDRGNIIVLEKRSSWRDIKSEIIKITPETEIDEIRKLDMIFGGGAQDREQEIVMNDLQKEKGKVLRELIENDIPALFVCGSPQLMGHYYEPAEGKVIKGLGIFDMETKHPGLNRSRLIGNIVAEVCWDNLGNSLGGEAVPPLRWIVGFENHGGRTYLGKTAKPFAKVIKGFGNNGEDGTEGVVYKNAMGCYLHGPLLPKNPEIADYFIGKALKVKYKNEVVMSPLDDRLEHQAKEIILKKLNVAL